MIQIDTLACVCNVGQIQQELFKKVLCT